MKKMKMILICVLIIIFSMLLCGSLYKSSEEVSDLARESVRVVTVNKVMDMTKYERFPYTVQFGDSLSLIAEKFCPEEMDYYDYLEHLKKVNHCSDTIYEGQEIYVYKKK